MSEELSCMSYASNLGMLKQVGKITFELSLKQYCVPKMFTKITSTSYDFWKIATRPKLKNIV